MQESRVGELTGLTTVGRIPVDGRLAAVGPDSRFEEGDVLLVLLALMVLSCLLSQVITGAPTVVMLAPVAFIAAARTGIKVRPLMMGIPLASSITFLAPVSHRANLLVMGAGGYRTKDYLRVGSSLTVAALALIALLVSLLFPF